MLREIRSDQWLARVLLDQNQISYMIPTESFVDISFDLYVADSVNNRIQRFSSGQMNATTVAGNGTSGTIFLKTPMDILLDGDGYLFIVDSR